MTVHVNPGPVHLRKNPLIRWLHRSGLDPDHFVVFGSAPLLAHGLRSEVRDLDVLARGEVWRKVSEAGELAKGTITGDEVRQFCDGRIHFTERWISPEWDTDKLIDEADIFDGLRFARLSEVRRYKDDLARAKDSTDRRRLRELLTAGCP